ncbi:MAG TPA: lipopolysaccharide kinase InaA family protein [Kiritimatiellia bacterium]|nr:lipopolysaccharide kinase InaA family protein [Kiritimatiellia bacterium]
MPGATLTDSVPVRRLRILEDEPEAAEVRDFIATGRWRETGAFARLPTRNPRYEVYSLVLPASQTACILKIAAAAPAGHRPARRLNTLASHLLRDPSRRALLGARRLAEAGVPTYRPLACWQARRASRWRDSFLLYAQIPARFTLRHCLLGTAGLPPDENARALQQFSRQLADVIAAMHRRGLRHDDLACGNFLIADDGTIHLIDTDHVHPVRLRFPRFLKRFFDLDDLRRLDLPEPLRREFLRRYLGDRDSPFWWRVHLFWRAGARHPLRWLRRRLRLRPPSRRPAGL